jgi:hypothetical protein
MFDYLGVVRNFYGHEGTLFAVLTTYESYRVFWSNSQEDGIAYSTQINVSELKSKIDGMPATTTEY